MIKSVMCVSFLPSSPGVLVAVCLDPCHVSRYPNSSYDSIDFSQSCDSGKPHDLSQLSDISNIPPVNGIQ